MSDGHGFACSCFRLTILVLLISSTNNLSPSVRSVNTALTGMVITSYGLTSEAVQTRVTFVLVSRWRHVGIVTKTVGYHRARVSRYSNSDSTFHLIRLTMSGDISVNPGPAMEKPKCQECSRTIARNHRATVCSSCGSKYHIKCGGVTPKQHKTILTTFDITFPFASLSNESFLALVEDKEQDISISSLNDAETATPHIANLAASLDYSPKSLRIAHLNICSLRNKLDELRVLQKLCKFDIIAITESHLNNKDRNAELNIDGLKLIRKDRTGRKGDGCVLYYREDLGVIHQKDLNDMDIEAIWIEAKLPTNSVLFSVVYRPPDHYDFFEKFNSVLERAWLKSASIFLLGDFNCDQKYFVTPVDISPPTSSVKLNQTFEMFNMQNVITTDTRVTPTSSTLIDLIITTRKDLIRVLAHFPWVFLITILYMLLLDWPLNAHHQRSCRYVTTRNSTRRVLNGTSSVLLFM